MSLDMGDFEEKAGAVMKMIASSKPWEMCLFYIRGLVFGCKPGETCRPLFHLEGYNIRQISDLHETMYHLLSREVLLYKDLTSEEVLQVWENPFNGKKTEVITINNDPVNIPLPLKVQLPFSKVFFPKPALCSNFESIIFEMFLQYPNPLNPEQYADFTAGSVYEGAEFFHYISPKSNVQSKSASVAPALVTWFRISQWLPWMQMGASEGRLLYTAGCQKFEDCESLAKLAPDLMEIVHNKYPEYLQPPQEFKSPNETSWSSFKKLVDGRREKGEDDVQMPPPAHAEGEESQGVVSSINNLADFFEDVQDKFLYAAGPVYMKVKDQKAKKIFLAEGIIKLNHTTFDVANEVLRISSEVSTGYKEVNSTDDCFLKTWKMPDSGQEVTVEPFSYKGSVDIPFSNMHIDEQTTNNTCVRGAVKSSDVRVSDAFVIFHSRNDKDKGGAGHCIQGSWLHIQPLPEWLSDGQDGELVFHLAVGLADKATSKDPTSAHAAAGSAALNTNCPFKDLAKEVTEESG